MCVKLYVMEVTGEEEEVCCQPGYCKKLINRTTQAPGEASFGDSSSHSLE